MGGNGKVRTKPLLVHYAGRAYTAAQYWQLFRALVQDGYGVEAGGIMRPDGVVGYYVTLRRRGMRQIATKHGATPFIAMAMAKTALDLRELRRALDFGIPKRQAE
jgi:hypothetical protein